MSPALLLAAAATMFAVLPHAARGGMILGTLVPMALGIALAVAASGRVSAFSLAVGAIAAFVGQMGWLLSPALGGALLVSLAYTERLMRVREIPGRAIHGALSFVGGACAGALASGYASAPLPVRGVALVVAAVLCAGPLLTAADDARTALLESAAAALTGPVAASLRAGADLLRCADPRLLDRDTASKVKSSWRSLERLVEARLRLQNGAAPRSETATLVVTMVERQIIEHVQSLTRAYTAATTKGAAEVGLDDSALQGVHARGEALEEESRAIVEVKAS
jgi:hypothetical protein